jgi:hypothetical protein
MPDTQKQDDGYYKPRLEHFEVVCIKDGASVLTATPEDFKRIPVDAEDPLAAQMNDEVRKQAEGHVILFAAKPGIMTDPEVMARSRSFDSNQVDRSKL